MVRKGNKFALVVSALGFVYLMATTTFCSSGCVQRNIPIPKGPERPAPIRRNYQKKRRCPELKPYEIRKIERFENQFPPVMRKYSRLA